MSKEKPVALICRSFKTQKECLVYFQDLRRWTTPGTPIPAADQPDLLALLKRHPEASRLIGCGLDYFTVGYAEPYNSLCFFVVRHDGSREAFSLHACVTGQKRTGPAWIKEIAFDTPEIFEDSL